MSWINMHTHCYFCDGQGAPGDYVAAAVREGMTAIGFSCHAPLPFETDWTMKPERLSEYCQTIRDLDVRSGRSLKVHLGLEVDYIPDRTGPAWPWVRDLGLDYTIGSVHHAGVFDSGRVWSVDGEEEEYLEGVEQIYGGQVRPAVEAYYRWVTEMIESQRPDILGHIDVIKKNNVPRGGDRPDAFCFDESADWYQAAVVEALKAAAREGTIVEVNTGGLARGRVAALYPSDWILEQCRERGIRVMLNADAHRAHQQTAFFEETAAKLLAMGFEALWYRHSGEFRPFRFNEKGLDGEIVG